MAYERKIFGTNPAEHISRSGAAFTYELTSDAATAPVRQTVNSAGYDLCACLISQWALPVEPDEADRGRGQAEGAGRIVTEPRDVKFRNEKNAEYGWRARTTPTAYGQWTVPLYPGHRALIPLGIKAHLPQGYYAKLAIRSGMAWNKGLILGNGPGIIDGDYPNEWMAIIENKSDVIVEIIHGERLVQCVLLKYEVFPLVEAEVRQTTDRSGGFGSTGS